MYNINLAGSWTVIPDYEDTGLKEEWQIGMQNIIPDAEKSVIQIPGCLEENRIGKPVNSKTVWTTSTFSSEFGENFGREFYDDDLYKPYRDDRNYRFTYWLQPETRYIGAAWYFKEIVFPENISARSWELYIERAHWKTMAWFNAQYLGSNDSLSVPHKYTFSVDEKEKKGILAIRVDNRIIYDVGLNAHSVSDHTQGSWNGIIGKIELRPVNNVSISCVEFYGNTERKSGLLKIEAVNRKNISDDFILNIDSMHQKKKSQLKTENVITLKPGGNTICKEIEFDSSVCLWNEHEPSLININVELKSMDNEILDEYLLKTGLRDIRTDGQKILINNKPVSFRGTLECCVFPKTGYPTMEKDEWIIIYKKLKSFGFNHLRFHSWCPPEAAFEAADELGVYLQVECPVWKNHDTKYEGDFIFDNWLFQESDKIVREYGNHPSFVLFNSGNEPDGRHEDFLGSWVNFNKLNDGRRLYTSSSGWSAIPENEYHVLPEPRIQAWGEGLDSRINKNPPETVTDYKDICKKYEAPVIVHENGQWCVFPDFSEMKEYTGYLKPKNFEVFQDILKRRGLEDKAEDFLMASGKLQLLCYKEEIESALRTKNLSGFQLLGLTDFPGQGTALVGVLNAFWQEKGYCEAAEFRKFCGDKILLARLSKRYFKNNELMNVDIDFYNYSSVEIPSGNIVYRVIDKNGKKRYESVMEFKKALGTGLNFLGSISIPLSGFESPAVYQLEMEHTESGVLNNWNFWLYPQQQIISYEGITVTTNFEETINALNTAEKILFLIPPSSIENDVETGFSSAFWNTSWTGGQAPHTLGINCDASHPVFSEFPTENWSDWQWWEPVHDSSAMILDELPSDLKPLIQPVDTWFRSHKLALLFECKVGTTKLMVSSIDFSKLETKMVSRQLLISIISYMRGFEFNPEVVLKKDLLKKMFKQEVL